jgi:hypothetical protein
MKTLVMVGSSVLLVSAMLPLSCGESGKTDCEKAKPPAKTKQLGESCTTSTYGTCPTIFDDCVADGFCLETTNGKVCSNPCATYANCPSGMYCVAGPDSSTKVCTPGATCETVCDGSTCCAYSPNPADPTVCVQGACTTT